MEFPELQSEHVGGFGAPMSEGIGVFGPRTRLSERHLAALATILDRPGHGVVRIDIATGTVIWSDGSYRVHGRPRWRIVATLEDYLACLHPDDIANFRLTLADPAVGVDLAMEYRVLRSDDSVRVVQLRATATAGTDSDDRTVIAVVTDVTDSRRTEIALRDRLDFAHAIMTSSPDRLLVVDVEDLRIAEAGGGSHEGPNLTGLRLTEIVVHSADQPKFHEWIARLGMLSDDEVDVVTVRSRAGDGWHWYDVRAVVFSRDDVSGTVAQVLVVARDVHDTVEASAALAVSERHFRQVFDRSPVGMAILDHTGGFADVNDAFCLLLSRDPQEFADARYLDVIEPADRVAAANALAEGFALDLRESQALPSPTDEVTNTGSERRFVTGDGSIVVARVRMSPYGESHNQQTLLSLEDLTASKQIEEDLRHDAMHDNLTGLPNRRLVTDRVTGALQRGRRNSTITAVLFIDLDGLKRVNDALGHEAGDVLIVQTAERIRGALRDTDTLGRIGGDEFVAVCEDVDGEAAIREIGQRVIEATRAQLQIGEESITPGVSIGVAISRGASDTSIDLLRRADAAMYRAKSLGGSQVIIAEVPVPAFVRQSLVDELQSSLESDAMTMHYQPITSFDGRLLGFEAMLRWPHPTRGLVAPSTVPGLLDGADLAAPLAVWSVRRTLADLAAAQQEFGLPDRLIMWVNVAGRALMRRSVGEQLRDLLEASADVLPADSLVLEVRESDLASIGRRGVELHALAVAGVPLGVDRFGAESAPLASLRRLPLRSLKFDRGLVTRAARDHDDAGFMNALAAASAALSVMSVATGVETQAQYDVALECGLDGVQGRLVAPPAPLAEHADLLRA